MKLGKMREKNMLKIIQINQIENTKDYIEKEYDH